METINLPVSVRQRDGHSCANFVCVYSYVASILSIKYSTKDDWLVSFNDMVIKHIITERKIMDCKKDLKTFCLFSQKKDCVIESLQEISEPELFIITKEKLCN